MVGTKYLSELVDFNRLYVNVVNIIQAPTGSGKTYFALHAIPEMCKDPLHQALYLIDTINGKEQILRNYNAWPVTYNWITDVGDGYECAWETRDEHVVIMTYAKLGYILQRKPNFCGRFSYIICDELHKLIDFASIKPIPNLHTIAKLGLEQVVSNDITTVIALTATPQKVCSFFQAEYRTLLVDPTELRHYETKKIVKYSSLDNLIKNLSPNETGIFYTKHVKKMKAITEKAAAAGLNPIAIWSVRSKDHDMDEEQRRALSVILEDFRIPSEYNFLLINASCETCIKIKSKVDYVIVNDTEKDIQIQVRGRVDHDLDTLYLLAEDSELGQVIQIPDDFLGKELYTEDKDKLCISLDLRDKNRRVRKWNSVKPLIIENGGYKVVEKRKNNRRYAIITKK